MPNLNAFKAYDIRGRIPEEINESLAYDIARAFCALVNPRRVAVGYDIRQTSPELAAAIRRGLADCGSEALDIGLWGTEAVYFATLPRRSPGPVRRRLPRPARTWISPASSASASRRVRPIRSTMR